MKTLTFLTFLYSFYPPRNFAYHYSLLYMALPISLLSIILGIVEGLTEFIPVSSTGHLIIADYFLQFKQALGSPEKAELFEVVIQLGAILAIGFIYRRDLWSAIGATN